MGFPSPTDPTAVLSQILLKQGEMGAQLAVIGKQLEDLPDHEVRIRALEVFRWKTTGIAIAAGALSGVAGSLLSHVSLH